jgi:hypothetical protein
MITQLPKQIVEEQIASNEQNDEAFVYQFTNLKNNKKYLGYHKGDTNDDYMHSSTNAEFKEAFADPDGEFRYEVTSWGDVEFCKAVEHQKLTAVDAANNPEYYNKTNGSPSKTTIPRVDMLEEMANEILNERSYDGILPVDTRLSNLSTFALQSRNFTLDNKHSLDIANDMNTTGDFKKYLIVELADRIWQDRIGNLRIGGSHTYNGFTKSRYKDSGRLPLLKLPKECHEHLTDQEVKLLANMLNPRKKRTLDTDLETIAKDVLDLKLAGINKNSDEVKKIYEYYNLNNAERRKVNKLVDEMHEKINPTNTNWINYGRGTPDHDNMKKLVDRENNKPGVFCRAFSSEKFGVTDSMDEIYKKIKQNIKIETFKIYIYFKNEDSETNWYNEKKPAYTDMLNHWFGKHNIKVVFDEMKTTRDNVTEHLTVQ